jgi:hypothetical protein
MSMSLQFKEEEGVELLVQKQRLLDSLEDVLPRSDVLEILEHLGTQLLAVGH